MSDFALLHTYLPEVAQKETRSMTTQGEPSLPDDTYSFLEAFCNTTDCDCRRAFIQVMSARQGQVVATLGYGWESPQFYRQWFGSDDRSIRDFAGVSLPPGTTQGPLSRPLVGLFERLLKHDPDYQKRIVRHYSQFKEALQAHGGPSSPPPGPALDTPEACLEVLARMGMHPTRTWFEPGPERYDSAAETVERQPSNLAPEHRYLAVLPLRKLWGLWAPEHPCLEDRYAAALGHLYGAFEVSAREEMEKYWQIWLETGVSTVVDDEGHLLPDVVRILDNDDSLQAQGPVHKTLMASAILMLSPPAYEPAVARFSAMDFSTWENPRECQALEGMVRVHRGDLPGALTLFDRLARQESSSLLVHLAAGLALSAAGEKDARVARQAEWYLKRAEQRLHLTPGLATLVTMAALQDLADRKGARR